MKKFILSLFLLGMSMLSMADIPAGKVIYLDVSQCPKWQGAPCYLLYLSRAGGMTHVMQAVPGKPNMLAIALPTAALDCGSSFNLLATSCITWNVVLLPSCKSF